MLIINIREKIIVVVIVEENLNFFSISLFIYILIASNRLANYVIEIVEKKFITIQRRLNTQLYDNDDDIGYNVIQDKYNEWS